MCVECKVSGCWFYLWYGCCVFCLLCFFFCKQKTAYEMRISDWSSDVCSSDLTSGRRALLNLGHTFGHALEAETGFSGKLLHGEGVALGMVLAAHYSARRGELSPEDAERVAGAIARAGLPSEVSALDLDTDGAGLVAHMLHDKKMDAGTLPFI